MTSIGSRAATACLAIAGRRRGAASRPTTAADPPGVRRRHAPSSISGRWSASARRPAGLGRRRRDPALHQGADGRHRRAGGRAGLRGEDADRPGEDGERARHDSRRAPGAHHPRRPLRHEALPAVPLRRRQRRRVEHGVPDRDGARAEGPQEPLDHRAALPRRRGGVHRLVPRRRPHLRQPALRAGGEAHGRSRAASRR